MENINLTQTSRKNRFFEITLWICLLTSINAAHSFGQKLIESRQSSFYTYIYKISDKEARKIYRTSVLKVDTSFFHTLVDSFPTDSQYVGKLPQGHYLKTYANKSKQNISITTVQDFNVYIFNNNTDLCVQVFDLQGKAIKNARVKIRIKRLDFHKKTQSYVDKKSNQKGLLKVTYHGFTAYYQLSRDYNNSSIKRGTRKVVYGTPLKYTWIPVNFFVHLPVDGIMSFIRRRPQGTIAGTRWKIINWCRSFDRILDHSYSNLNFKNKHSGYIVFSKPKYKPDDTLKFKAFFVDAKGHPVDKRITVTLENGHKDIELTKLTPYGKEGGYHYAFYLHDSLQLKLDRNYSVRLKLNKYKEYLSGSFRYEDYELSKIKLAIRQDGKEHYKNKKLSVYAKGTDENNLNLLDARLEIVVKPKQIYQYLERNFFIPDTLLFLTKQLNPTGETEIVIPDSVFPKANFEYQVEVKMLTSDNETITESKDVTYYYDSQSFEVDLNMDSIQYTYFKNGEPQPKKVEVFAEDNFGNKTQVYKGFTPCKTGLKQYYASYTILSDSLSKTIIISDEPSLLQCFAERTNDSIFITVNNPRNIPFIYDIYKKNNRKASGFTDSLIIAEKECSSQNYYISIRYLWGGKVKEENFGIPLVERRLNISVTQPDLIYPGQKVHIEALVTNVKGKPVKGADITAFSLTKKFNYTAPVIPSFEKERKGKNLINNFHLKDLENEGKAGLHLDYESWKLLAGLDTIEYYRFLYPKNAIYRFEYTTPDSITQFAPFVVYKGNIEPIHVIYVDHIPVYFSWTTADQPYSFKIEKGYHNIRLRTSFNEIEIQKMFFSEGEKVIFSIDRSVNYGGIIVKKTYSELSENEKRNLTRYIVPYRDNFKDQFAYIESGGHLQLLNTNFGHRYNNLAGPFSGILTFHLMDSLSINFKHEPNFEYEFSDKQIKMRCPNKWIYPSYLSTNSKTKSFDDVVLTKAGIEEKWQKHLDTKRYSTNYFNYPKTQTNSTGRLTFDFENSEEPSEKIPLNVLVFKHDNYEFLRIYSGNTKTITQLENGYYKLIFFYPGAAYHVEDSIYVQPYGLNYFCFDIPDELEKDTFGIYVSNLIENTVFKPLTYYHNNIVNNRKIRQVHQQQFRYLGEGNTIKGYVNDESGEPIPGVQIVVSGTTFGTISDSNGYYYINVPPRFNTLIFSHMGYQFQEVTIDSENTINLNLQSDNIGIYEVMVVGEKTGSDGIVAVRDRSVAISHVTSASHFASMAAPVEEMLQGRLAGVSISAFSGDPGAANIRIRGMSTTSSPPLLIVNGVVFTGDISEIDQTLVESMQVLKDSALISIYGSQASNGVVIINTKKGTYQPAASPMDKGAEYDEQFLEMSINANSIRDNFSDGAFWQPNLKTDKNGKVSFDVVFPDDITSWQTYYMAMNNKRQSGQTEYTIKSYKPIMAQLSLPRFLLQSDSCSAIGKVLNYSPGPVQVEKSFESDGTKLFQKDDLCINSIVDTLPLIAKDDSLEAKYYITTKNGYFDGEQRNIPVLPKGMEETKGSFHILGKDTIVKFSFDSTMGNVILYARADILDVLEDEISWIMNYKYYCNEQIASKLKALTAEKAIKDFKGEKFRGEKEIKKLIRLLKKNQVESGLWGWWKDSKEQIWISIHVLEALMSAEQQGYITGIDKEQILERLLWELNYSDCFDDKTRILKILTQFDTQINYRLYVHELGKHKKLSFNALLRIIELKQLFDLEYNLDTLDYYKKSTMFGNIYYSNNNVNTNLLVNDIQNTLLVYQIFQRDTAVNADVLRPIRNYFFEKRNHGNWTNTYESVEIIATILPDLLNGKEQLEPPKLNLHGDINKTVTVFPFEMQLKPNQQIEINKTGDFPVYLTSYQRYWNNTPKQKTEDFEISTSFENYTNAFLQSGEEVKLIARVKVLKEANYVMINIPIPAGCSYSDKKTGGWRESHREYFKNETSVFCEYLPAGDYIFEVNLIAQYAGVYTLNPAKAQLMYFPTFYGNNGLKTVRIQ